MQFYRVTAKIDSKKNGSGKENRNEAEKTAPTGRQLSEIRSQLEEQRQMEERRHEIRECTDEVNSALKKEAVFLSDMKEQWLMIGAAAESPGRARQLVSGYLEILKIRITELSFEEQTMERFGRLVSRADGRGYLNEGHEIFEQLGISGLEHNGRGGTCFGENLLEAVTGAECEKAAGRYMMEGTMLPELRRIGMERKNNKIQGHPVHYMIRTDDHEVRRESCRALLSALYGNGRIRNRRYVFIDIGPHKVFSEKFFSDIYESSAGGAVVLRYTPAEETEENEYADSERELIRDVSGMVSEYRHKVLTILCFPRECTRIRKYFEEYLLLT